MSPPTMVMSRCCGAGFQWIEVGKERESGLPMNLPLCDRCNAWCSLCPSTESSA